MSSARSWKSGGGYRAPLRLLELLQNPSDCARDAGHGIQDHGPGLDGRGTSVTVVMCELSVPRAPNIYWGLAIL